MNATSTRREVATTETEFNLGALLDVFVLYRRMMVLVFAAMAAIGFAWVLLSDPVYQADILVQVEESGVASTAQSLLGNLSGMFDVKSSADTEMQVLQSRLVVASTVDDLRLYIEAEPVRLPIVGRAIARANAGLSQPGLLGLGGYCWAAERIDVAQFNVPKALEGRHFYVTLERDGRYLLSGPDLRDDVTGHIGQRETFSSNSGPITVEVESADARPGARFRFTRQSRPETIAKLQRNLTISEEGKDSDVLRVKLQGTDAELVTRIMTDIARFYVNQNVARKSEDAAHSLEFLQGQLPELKRKLDSAETVFTELRSKLQSVDMEGEAKSVLQQSAENESQLTQMLQKRADLVSRFTPDNKAVQAVDKQIAILRMQSASFNRRIDQLPESQRQIVRAERDVKLNNDLYVGMLNSIEQLQLLTAGRIGNVRVIDSALLPDHPVRLRRLILLGVVLFVAAFAAAVSAYLRNLFFGGVTDIRDIEDNTNLKVFSVIPVAERRRFNASPGRRRKARQQRLLAYVDPYDPAVESLRSLRTALQFSMQDSGNNIIMLAGPSPGIGKSFVSSNLAAVLSTLGKRVVLVDADLRRSGQRHLHGNVTVAGLGDVIAGHVTVDSAIRRIEQTELDFLPCGSLMHNAADLLNRADVQKIFQTLASRYDVVVVDTAPLLAVPDAAILAPLAKGNVFLVARASVTKTGELEECARRLHQVGVDVTGVILNGIDPHAGRFRYGSRYGSYRYVNHDHGDHSGQPQNAGERR